MAPTFVQDLRVYRIRYLPVGQSVTIDVKPGDPMCGFNDEFYCRTVRVTGPPGAMVALQASTNAPTGVAQLTPDGSLTTCCSLAATVNMPASGTGRVFLETLGPASMTYSFTLTSAILP
jgi:hypothetical protein